MPCRTSDNEVGPTVFMSCPCEAEGSLTYGSHRAAELTGRVRGIHAKLHKGGVWAGSARMRLGNNSLPAASVTLVSKGAKYGDGLKLAEVSGPPVCTAQPGPSLAGDFGAPPQAERSARLLASWLRFSCSSGDGPLCPSESSTSRRNV